MFISNAFLDNWKERGSTLQRRLPLWTAVVLAVFQSFIRYTVNQYALVDVSGIIVYLNRHKRYRKFTLLILLSSRMREYHTKVLLGYSREFRFLENRVLRQRTIQCKQQVANVDDKIVGNINESGATQMCAIKVALSLVPASRGLRGLVYASGPSEMSTSLLDRFCSGEGWKVLPNTSQNPSRTAEVSRDGVV
jgi:hypothetical protein